MTMYPGQGGPDLSCATYRLGEFRASAEHHRRAGQANGARGAAHHGAAGRLWMGQVVRVRVRGVGQLLAGRFAFCRAIVPAPGMDH